MIDVDDYRCWRCDPEGKAIKLDSLLGAADDLGGDIWAARPVADRWPKDALMSTEKAPKTAKLFDYPFNRHRLVVVSPRVADFVRGQNVSHIEFLPVGIQLPTRVEPYVILNLLDPVDCLDAEASSAQPMASNPDVMMMSRLILDGARVDPARALFPVRGARGSAVMTPAFAAALEAQNFTAISTMPTSMWS